MTEHECHEFLGRASFGRLRCSLGDQPYIVPVCLACESDCIYVVSTFGKKIEWMRANPKVCIQIDEIADQSLRLVDIVRIVRRTSAIDSLIKVTVLSANLIPPTSLSMGRALSLYFAQRRRTTQPDLC